MKLLNKTEAAAYIGRSKKFLCKLNINPVKLNAKRDYFLSVELDAALLELKNPIKKPKIQGTRKNKLQTFDEFQWN